MSITLNSNVYNRALGSAHGGNVNHGPWTAPSGKDRTSSNCIGHDAGKTGTEQEWCYPIYNGSTLSAHGVSSALGYAESNAPALVAALKAISVAIHGKTKALSTSPFILHLDATGELIGLPTFEEIPTDEEIGKEKDGSPIFKTKRVPIQYVKKELIKAGHWTIRGARALTGEHAEFDMTPQDIGEVVDNFQALKAAGVLPFIPDRHDFRSSANNQNGNVIELDRDGDSLYAKMKLVGEEAIEKALKNDVSVGLMDGQTDAVVDAFGKKYKGYVLHHVSLTPNPNQPHLGPFVRIAASADSSEINIPVFELSGDGEDWVTLNGVHVLIKGGVVSKGPSRMLGKTPYHVKGDEILKRAQNAGVPYTQEEINKLRVGDAKTISAVNGRIAANWPSGEPKSLSADSYEELSTLAAQSSGQPERVTLAADSQGEPMAQMLTGDHLSRIHKMMGKMGKDTSKTTMDNGIDHCVDCAEGMSGGMGLSADDQAVLAKIVGDKATIKDVASKVISLSADSITLKSDLDKIKGEKATAENALALSADPKLDPANQAAFDFNVETLRENCVKAGAISSTDAALFTKLFRPTGKTTTLALSASGENGHPFEMNFWRLMAKLATPVKTGNETSRESNPLLQLDADGKQTTKPDMKKLAKAMHEAGYMPRETATA